MSNQHGPVIAIYNHDGGAGKTTTTLHLASYLAQRANFPPPLLIDFDPQAVLTKRIFGENTAGLATISDAIFGKAEMKAYGKKDPLRDTERLCDFRAVAADTRLAEVATQMQGKSPNHHFLKMAIDKSNVASLVGVRPILIDCAPGLDILTVNMMFAADYVVIPVKCDEDAASDVRRVMGMVEDLGVALNKAPKIIGVVMTHVDNSTVIYRKTKPLLEALGLPIRGEISLRTGQDRHDHWRADYAPVCKKVMEVLNGN